MIVLESNGTIRRCQFLLRVTVRVPFFLLCVRLHNKKNWLFSNTTNGAHASSILYSIVETAKANNLVPFDYLHHILNSLSEPLDEESLNALLPWRVSLPVQ